MPGMLCGAVETKYQGGRGLIECRLGSSVREVEKWWSCVRGRTTGDVRLNNGDLKK